MLNSPVFVTLSLLQPGKHSDGSLPSCHREPEVLWVHSVPEGVTKPWPGGSINPRVVLVPCLPRRTVKVRLCDERPPPSPPHPTSILDLRPDGGLVTGLLAQPHARRPF